jgi:aminopeptidase-like protein
MTRCLDPDFPYPEYHTSLDTPDLMDEQLLQEFYQVLQRVVAALEHNHSLYRNFTGLICLSNPKYDLYFERHDPAVTKDLNHDSDKWGHLLNHLFRCFDGSRSILEIAEEHDLPFEPLYQYLRKFQDKGLITMEFAPVRRLPVVSKFPAGHHGYD